MTFITLILYLVETFKSLVDIREIQECNVS